MPGFLQMQKTPVWPEVLSVDIGTRNVKYIYLRRKGGKLWIEKFGKFALGKEGGEVTADSIRLVLGKMFARSKAFRKAKVVAGVEGPFVVVKKDAFPKLPKKELDESVFFELQQHFENEGHEIEGLAFDYITLGQSTSKADHLDLITMGAPIDMVQDKIQAFVTEGVVPAKITPNIHALKKLWPYMPLSEQQEVIGILDIGAERSLLVIFHKGQIDYYREIVIGGDEFTKAITGTIFHEGKAIQFTYSEAVEFKYKYGYPMGFSEGMTFRGAPLTEVGAMMRPAVERMTGEIHRSIGFYADKSSGREVETLYLTGGGGRLKHLPDVLAKKLNIPVSPLPFPKGIDVTGGKDREKAFRQNFLDQAMSFALALEENTAGNLLPAEMKKVHRMNFIHRAVQAAAIVVVLIIAGFWTMIGLEVKRINKDINQLESRVKRYRSNGQVFAALSLERQGLTGKINELQKRGKQDDKVVRFLQLFSHAVPEPLELVSLQLKEEMITPEAGDRNQRKKAEPRRASVIEIRGCTEQVDSDCGIFVAQMILDLEKSAYFESVRLDEEVYPENELPENAPEEAKYYYFRAKAVLKNESDSGNT